MVVTGGGAAPFGWMLVPDVRSFVQCVKIEICTYNELFCVLCSFVTCRFVRLPKVHLPWPQFMKRPGS